MPPREGDGGQVHGRGAAIDHQRAAGDHGGQRRSEEHHGVRHVLGAGGTAHGHVARDEVVGRVGIGQAVLVDEHLHLLVGHLGAHPAGAHGVHAHALLAVVARQRTHKTDERVLHRHVADHARPREVTGERREHDDVAAPLDQLRQQFARADEGGVEVQARRERPRCVVGGERIAHAVAARVGDEHVDAAELLAGLGQCAPHVAGAGGIAGHREAAELRGDRFELREAPPHQHHAAARRDELRSHRRADAGAAARDERDLAGHGISCGTHSLCLLVLVGVDSRFGRAFAIDRRRRVNCPTAQSRRSARPASPWARWCCR